MGQSDEMRKRVEERVRAGSGGFDRTCGLRVVAFGEGRATVEMDVTAALQNSLGSLHGGAVATLVDNAGTLAIMTADRQARPGVTTDLNTSYFAPAPAGSTVVADASVLKIGKTLAFVSVDVRRASDGVLVAQGRMTKFQG
jgi:acyl-coenzyme A thioesterase 13